MHIVLALLGLILLPGLCYTKGVVSDPTFFDGGNQSLIIAVSASTRAPVIISTTAVSHNELTRLGMSHWQHREIINVSTACQLMILTDSGTYTSFSSTFGVVLGSGTTVGLGDSYVVPHQGAVWGIWGGNGNVCHNGAGAGGVATWYKKPEE